MEYAQVEIQLSSDDITFRALDAVAVTTLDAETCRDCLGTMDSPMLIRQLPFKSRGSTVGRAPSDYARNATQRSRCTRDEKAPPASSSAEMVFRFVPQEDMQVYLSTCEVHPSPPERGKPFPLPSRRIVVSSRHLPSLSALPR